MRLRFTKMHGCGNDFIMVDSLSQMVRLSSEQIRFLCDRHFGVGCDQLLLVEPPSSPDVDFRYRIFNQDGNEVENCGNGARCFAKFVLDRRLTANRTIKVETNNGRMTLEVQANGEVSVDMGAPRLIPSTVPFLAEQQAATYPLNIDGKTFDISAVSMGNPHGVLVVDNTETTPVEQIGKLVQQSSAFPEGVNVGFMAVLSASEINLRVYERGVGETLACGTGACAAVVAGQLRGLLSNRVKVNLLGGTVYCDWHGEGTSVIKTGPATTVYHGQIKI